MRKFIKPACLLMYFLAIFNFFVLGMIAASLLGVADGQGLAAGAIVLTYGIMVAIPAFIATLFLASRLPVSRIVAINKVLGVIFILLVVYWYYKTQVNT